MAGDIAPCFIYAGLRNLASDWRRSNWLISRQACSLTEGLVAFLPDDNLRRLYMSARSDTDYAENLICRHRFEVHDVD